MVWLFNILEWAYISQRHNKSLVDQLSCGMLLAYPKDGHKKGEIYSNMDEGYT